MPLYYFKCRECEFPQRLILSPQEAKGDLPCKQEGCSGKLVRTPKPPTTQTKETLDNGVQVKRVERLKDVEELMDDRAHTDYRES